MSSDKRVYNSQTVAKANKKFMLRRFERSKPKPIRTKRVKVETLKSLTIDQTKIGDE